MEATQDPWIEVLHSDCDRATFLSTHCLREQRYAPANREGCDEAADFGLLPRQAWLWRDALHPPVHGGVSVQRLADQPARRGLAVVEGA